MDDNVIDFPSKEDYSLQNGLQIAEEFLEQGGKDRMALISIMDAEGTIHCIPCLRDSAPGEEVTEFLLKTFLLSMTNFRSEEASILSHLFGDDPV